MIIGVYEATKHRIESMHSRRLFIPSHNVDYLSLPIVSASNGIKSILNIPLINVNNISIINLNCFLNINGKILPDKNVSTICAKLFEP